MNSFRHFPVFRLSPSVTFLLIPKIVVAIYSWRAIILRLCNQPTNTQSNQSPNHLSPAVRHNGAAITRNGPTFCFFFGRPVGSFSRRNRCQSASPSTQRSRQTPQWPTRRTDAPPFWLSTRWKCVLVPGSNANLAGGQLKIWCLSYPPRRQCVSCSCRHLAKSTNESTPTYGTAVHLASPAKRPLA